MRQGGKVLRVIDNINTRWGKLISFIVLFMIGLTIIEVTTRYFFNRPTNFSHESITMLYAGYCILGAGYSLVPGIRPPPLKMDIFFERFPARIKAFVEMVSTLALFIFVIVLIWKGWEQAYTSFTLNEHSWSVWGPPLYPIKFFLPIGASLYMVQAMAKFTRHLITFITNEETDSFITNEDT